MLFCYPNREKEMDIENEIPSQKTCFLPKHNNRLKAVCVIVQIMSLHAHKYPFRLA